jgi:hypothetical protein
VPQKGLAGVGEGEGPLSARAETGHHEKNHGDKNDSTTPGSHRFKISCEYSIILLCFSMI